MASWAESPVGAMFWRTLRLTGASSFGFAYGEPSVRFGGHRRSDPPLASGRTLERGPEFLLSGDSQNVAGALRDAAKNRPTVRLSPWQVQAEAPMHRQRLTIPQCPLFVV